MDWSSELRELKVDLDSFRRERERRAGVEEAERQQRRAEMNGLFQSLQIKESLSEMNRLLMDGQGELEVYVSWEPVEANVDEEEGETDGENEELEEETDSVSAILTWQEEGTREIVVDVGMLEKGYFLEVNGEDIRLEQDALRQALVRALREELGF